MKQVHDAIKIILSDREHYSSTLNWAVDYCRASLHMDEADLRVQCLYILNNIQRWRHPVAKAVRATLKQFAGVR